jgi:hypothetical protein
VSPFYSKEKAALRVSKGAFRTAKCGIDSSALLALALPDWERLQTFAERRGPTYPSPHEFPAS